MIDDAQLKRMEAENIACGDVENEWLVRNARRYMALRDSRNYSGAMGDKWGLRMTAEPLSANEIRELDAAADRLLGGGE